jgi:hypothetical protein
LSDADDLRGLAAFYAADPLAITVNTVTDAASALDMRIRIAPRVASAAVPGVGFSGSSRAARVRSGGVEATGLLTSHDVGILINAVRAFAEMAAAAVRMLYAGVAYANVFTV